MHFTEAAWRTFTQSFTTGCTVTSTRSVRLDNVIPRRLARGPGPAGWSSSRLGRACCVQNSVFGEGTYLTSDLSMALLYSPHSSGWQESLLGPLLSCVALCEVVDHPDVKCQVKRKGAGGGGGGGGGRFYQNPDSRCFADSEPIDRQRSRAKNSEGGEVPHKYFVVTNNQLLRVKYLLVYSQRRHLSR